MSARGALIARLTPWYPTAKSLFASPVRWPVGITVSPMYELPDSPSGFDSQDSIADSQISVDFCEKPACLNSTLQNAMKSIRQAVREAMRRQASRAAKARIQKFRETAVQSGQDPDAAMSAEMSRRRKLGVHRRAAIKLSLTVE